MVPRHQSCGWCDIHQPCVCFYGTTTPSTFWKALEGGAMMDGSLARFLVFVTDNDRPDRNRAAGIVAPPAPLLDALKAIIRGQGDPPPPGNLPDVHVPPMTASDEPTPFTVPMTAAAEALHEQKLAEEDAWARKVAGTPQAAIVNRLIAWRGRPRTRRCSRNIKAGRSGAGRW